MAAPGQPISMMHPLLGTPIPGTPGLSASPAAMVSQAHLLSQAHILNQGHLLGHGPLISQGQMLAGQLHDPQAAAQLQLGGYLKQAQLEDVAK